MVFWKKTGVLYVLKQKKGNDVLVVSKDYGYIRQKNNSNKKLNTNVLL